MIRRIHIASIAFAQILLPVSARAQAPVETVHLVFAGGANAGSYDAVGTKAGCSANATGPGSFGNQLSDSKGAPDKFNSLQLVVPSLKAAGTAAGTTEFQVIFGFGPLMHRTKTYTVNTIAKAGKTEGSGTIKIADAGKTAKVDIAVVTADGVKITGTITCNTVTRL